MLRALAERRGLESPQQLAKQVDRLRGTPLAIRWYVEAVAAGSEPRVAIENQSELLRFCLETIYRGLTETARQCLSVLYAAGGPLDAPQLAVISNTPADELNRALHDLQRRSLVEVQLGGGEGLHQRYSVTAATARYLVSVDRPSGQVLTDTENRLNELRKSEELRQQLAARDVTRPSYVDVVDDQYGAVAHLLQKAILTANRGTTARSEDLEKAKALAPEFYEVHRVEGFFATKRKQLPHAREAYERAYEMAPTAEARARVAFFFSWLLANEFGDLSRAEELAQGAHHILDSPATACRLAQIKMYGEDFNEAEKLLRSATSADDVRSVLIARTQLTSLSARRVQALTREHQAIAAVREGGVAIREVSAYLDTGVTDSVLRAKSLDLAADVLTAAARSPSVRDLRAQLRDTARFGRSRSAELLFHPKRPYVLRAGKRLLKKTDLADDAREELAALVEEIDITETEGAERSQGRVLSFDDERGYGFLELPDSDENAFFHRSDLTSQLSRSLLVPGAIVSCTLARDDRGLRASGVDLDISNDVEEDALRGRHAIVTEKFSTYLFARETKTKARLHVRAGCMTADDWNLARPGHKIRLDIELSGEGPSAIPDSVSLLT